MADAVDEFVDRCEAWIKDGYRDVEDILKGAFDDEVGDWFAWELIDKYISMEDLRTHFEDEYREALFNDVRDRIERMVDDYEDEEDDYEY